MKIIVGIAGEIAAGKTTATDYLKEKHGAVSFRFSEMLRDILDRLHIEKSRTNLQTLSSTLRQNFSEDIMSKVLVEDVKQSDAQFIITEGIRRPSDVTFLRELPNFHIIAIHTDAKLRYERLSSRNENPDDKTKTWEAFVHDGEQEAERAIQNIMSEAKFSIDNNGSMEELFENIDRIVNTLK